MSLVIKNREAAPALPASVAKGVSKTMARDAEANRKRARTLSPAAQQLYDLFGAVRSRAPRRATRSSGGGT